MNPAFLVVDKPAGVTSHDVVAAVRAITGFQKVGHTGTLDPFATGVLPLALDTATKLIQFLDESIKVYDATICFGRRTDTGDLTGEVIGEAELPVASLEEVEEVLEGFIGERLQKPPAYSAVKKDGKPLYYYARRGESVEVAPRPITIHKLELEAYDHATLRVLMTCSRGTYARVLADDIATALGSAGHLSALSRTRSGPFYLEDAVDVPTLAALTAAESGHTWQEVLMTRGRGAKRVPWRPRDEVRAALSPWIRRPMDALSHLPLSDLGVVEARRVARGAPPPPPPSGCETGRRYLVVCGDRLIAVAEVGASGPKTLRVVASP